MRELGWGKSTIEERIQEESQYLIQSIKASNGKANDPADLIGVAVSNIICSLLFGQRYDYDDTEFQALLKNVNYTVRDIEKNRGGNNKNSKMTSDELKSKREQFYTACEELNTFYRQKVEEAAETINSDPEPRDFLRLYLQELPKYNQGESVRLTEDWSVTITSNFFLAGSETTASTLKWAVLFMANYPDIQEKIHQEMDEVFGKEKHQFCLSDREKLPYTNATLSEIQRYSPILPFSVQHVTLEDVEVAGYMVPKDTLVS